MGYDKHITFVQSNEDWEILAYLLRTMVCSGLRTHIEIRRSVWTKKTGYTKFTWQPMKPKQQDKILK